MGQCGQLWLCLLCCCRSVKLHVVHTYVQTYIHESIHVCLNTIRKYVCTNSTATLLDPMGSSWPRAPWQLTPTCSLAQESSATTLQLRHQHAVKVLEESRAVHQSVNGDGKQGSQDKLDELRSEPHRLDAPSQKQMWIFLKYYYIIYVATSCDCLCALPMVR